MVDLYQDRQYVSQFGTDTTGIVLMRDQAPFDADGPVQVTMHNETLESNLFTREATHDELGHYSLTFSSTETGTVGPFQMQWSYLVDTVPQMFYTQIEIGKPAPAYDNLLPQFKDLVNQTYVRIYDMLDSPDGQVNLTTWYQAKFGRARLAQLLRIAVGNLNTVAQPHMTYSVDGVGGKLFPIDKWGPLLERALWLETLKHLIRSYVEIPEFQGGNPISTLNRRDYMDRWRTVLADEQDTYESQIDTFKIAHMGLGGTAILVSGGAYGKYYGVNRYSTAFLARPHYFVRGY